MRKKALAYVSDIILGRSGEVIGREAQKELIREFAQENDIELIEWFEDEMFSEDVLSRPGIRKLLACDRRCDLVLVDRVWALSRRPKPLKRFLAELDRKGLRLESATMLLDCISMMARWHYRKKRPRRRPAATHEVQRTPAAATVARPVKLNFSRLKREVEPA